MAYKYQTVLYLTFALLFSGTTQSWAASPSGTTIPSAAQIVDGNDVVWTVSDGVIYKGGRLAGYSNGVIELLYLKGLIYQENYAKNWWAWNGSGWDSVSNPTDISQVTAGSKLGINIDWVNDWGDRAMMFVDVMKIARGFATPTKYWDPASAPVAVDSRGWPTTDFGVTFITNVSDPLSRPLTTTFPSMFGTYNLSFTGRATVSGAGCCKIQNVNYDAGTRTTTAQVVVGPTDTQVALIFTGTSGGVQNLKLLRPGYPPDTQQVFTTQILNALAPFSTIRFMTPLLTNNSPLTAWKYRTLSTNPTQNTTTGIAWEYVVQLANASGKDIWINIPDKVDLSDTSPNNYVTQLASLLKATLSPGIHVYAEYSNEVWNGAFSQFQNNLTAASNDVNSGADSTLNYDGTGDKYYWALRRTAHQTLKISGLFKNVYGASAINTTIRPILMSQYAQPASMEDSLRYIKKNFGAPNQYIYAIGGAPYFWTSDSFTDLSGMFAALHDGINRNTLPQFIGGQTYNGVINWSLPMPTYKTLADYYGLKHVGYEGGINLGDGAGPNPRLYEQSLGDRRNNLLVQQTLADWYGCGNDLFMYYSLATFSGDYYGLYEDLSIATPKSTAIATVAGTPLATYNLCSPVLTNQLYTH